MASVLVEVEVEWEPNGVLCWECGVRVPEGFSIWVRGKCGKDRFVAGRGACHEHLEANVDAARDIARTVASLLRAKRSRHRARVRQALGCLARQSAQMSSTPATKKLR